MGKPFEEGFIFQGGGDPGKNVKMLIAGSGDTDDEEVLERLSVTSDPEDILKTLE